MIRPDLVWYRPRPGCRVSIILLDWGVRESFHSLYYLNRQTAARDQYEVIWLEFYGRKPAALRDMAFPNSKPPLLDQWIVAGYDDKTIFNKHRLYNLGLLVAQGHYCVICDSDAIFTPNFVAKVLQEFSAAPSAVLHLDEIRNSDPRFHPFAYPSIAEVLGPGCTNWLGTASRGLSGSQDMIHDANYGACMAAARDNMIAIGGADEHIDYLGYICGPYDLTFRLVNDGLRERWVRDEYLYHVWHPNESGINTDYHGPCDGRGMSLRALRARASGRVLPYLENPWVARTRQGERLDVHQLLQGLAEQQEPTWEVGNQPARDNAATLLQPDYHGFNIFHHASRWYGLRTQDGEFDPRRAHRYRVLLEGTDPAHIMHLADYYNDLPRSWWQRLGRWPMHEWPKRIVRQVRKEVGRFF